MLATVKIRPAVEADQATIKAMARAVRLIPHGLHWPRFLVAEEGGRVVGIWQVKVHKGGTREVASGAVLPEYQRRGIGAELIRALLAREHGQLYLRCDERRASFYERFGFRRVEPSELPSDFRRDYWMARIISAVPFFLLRRSVRIILMKRDP